MTDHSIDQRPHDDGPEVPKAFPNIAGRDAHVAGRGGDIFRDIERMNAIVARPAHVQKVDILFEKTVFA